MSWRLIAHSNLEGPDSFAATCGVFWD